jgi:hypothetical protein
MIWVAYYYDRSGVAVFETEIEALRYALANSMQVKRAPFGVDLFDHEPDHTNGSQ